MRQVELPDLHHAALAILMVEPHKRLHLCEELVWQAHVADKCVKRLRRLHSSWGDGSLRGAAIAHHKGCRTAHRSNDYLDALSVVLSIIKCSQNRNTRFCEHGRVCIKQNNG